MAAAQSNVRSRHLSGAHFAAARSGLAAPQWPKATARTPRRQSPDRGYDATSAISGSGSKRAAPKSFVPPPIAPDLQRPHLRIDNASAGRVRGIGRKLSLNREK